MAKKKKTDLPDTRSATLTPDEIKTISREGVCEAFLLIGLDTSSPAAIAELQRDMQHLRDNRKICETVKERGMLAIITAAVTGGIALLVAGLRMAIKQNG